MALPEANTPVTFDFITEEPLISKLIGSWESEENDKIKTRRDVRENKVNVLEARQNGEILTDETKIPDRTANTNIHRARVAFIQYLTQARRFLILKDKVDPKLYTEQHELWFTRGMRYPDWKQPWFKHIDSIQTHGGGALEVVYDKTKPFNCAIEFIPRDSLIFNLKTKNIQAAPRILRKYEISILELEEMAQDLGFNVAVVESIKDKFKKTEDFLCIYKMLFKRNRIVYNAWYSKDSNIRDWLRAPREHDIGLFEFDPLVVQTAMAAGNWEQVRAEFAIPKQLSKYPLMWFPFDVQENEELLQCQGRVALDIQEQEALTALISNTVNGSTRASRFYPTAEGLPGEDSTLRELGPLKPGIVMQGKIGVFQPEYPNNMILSVVQVLDQRKAQQTGNTDYAAIARKDANKTATEMQLAVQQSQALNTTELDIFSSPFLLTYALCFEIATHQAIFLLTNDEPPPSPELLFNKFNLSPAGDVEVVKRAEDRERAKEFFNIVKGTPLAEKLFIFLIKAYFPDEAQDWVEVLQTPDLKPLVAQLVNILTQIPTDELSPEQRQALQSVIISAQNVVGTGGNPEVSPKPIPQTAGNIPPVDEDAASDAGTS